jgi:hypothetical protein
MNGRQEYPGGAPESRIASQKPHYAENYFADRIGGTIDYLDETERKTE